MKNSKKTLIIAMYLPQYHTFKENDEWWGKGHTEWVSCKAAIPLFKKHNQPRIPLNNNYYDLSSIEPMIQQSKIAKKYGIDGFCFYHYWFNGRMIMNKPVDNFLLDKRVDIHFCFSWANHTWTNGPQRKGKVLIKQTYGDENDWRKHIEYLIQFFKDDRYIKVNGRPVMVIYDLKDINCWLSMKEVWKNECVKYGLKPPYFISTLKHNIDIQHDNSLVDAQVEYQPTFALSKNSGLNYAFWYNIKRIICKDFLHIPCKVNYNFVWKRILKANHSNEIKTFLGCYNDWDTTARWRDRGIVHLKSSPKRFGFFFKKQYERSVELGNDMMFITAWNEWSEGAYLEPDQKYGFAYLEEIRNVVRGD